MNNKSTDDKKFIAALSVIAELGPARMRKLDQGFQSFEQIWNVSSSEIAKKTGFDQKLARKIAKFRDKTDPDAQLDLLKQHNIQLLTQSDSAFPKQLKQISSPPFMLFCQGDVSALETSQIAVVGTRLPSQYGKTATEKLVDQLTRADLTITSGMANGIDSISHRSAIEANGKTIAVLGAGLVENSKNSVARNMAQSIVEAGGVVISEYHPLARATKFTFPARNRIIAGLALGVLVVEAGEKSGSLITANLALENNREVFAVPGSIFSKTSLGTNSLLGQGAHLAASANDILQVLGFSAPQKSVEQIIFENEKEKIVYKCLSFQPIHVDKISKKTQMNSSDVSALLSMMELRNMVKNVGAGMFIRK